MVKTLELIENLLAFPRIELRVHITRRIFPFIVPVENGPNRRLGFIA
jgi:hypothetical protein